MGFTFHLQVMEPITLKADNGWVAVDRNGIQFPWYTSPVLDILDTMDFTGKRIFEYGSGHSTLWYRSRGASVACVDSEKEWANLTRAFYTKNKEEYLEWIYKAPPVGKFDVVCIDGDFRDECFEHALRSLKPGGMIIIDNFEQPSVGYDFTKTREFLEYITVFYKDGFSFEIYKQEGHQDWQTLIIHVQK